MGYAERQKECSWTSPSGKVFKLKLVQEYELSKKHIGEVKNNPSRSYGKKNSRRTYRTVNSSADTFQDMGTAGADIPLQVVYTGENHDLEADKLWEALSERGRSKLQLLYGGIITVQVIEFKRKSGLIKNCACTTINIQLHEVAGNIYPQVKDDTSSKAVKTSAASMSALAEELSEAAETVSNPETFLSKLQNGINKAGGVFGNIQNTTFTGILSDLASGTLLVNPFVMGTQIGKLFNTAFSSYSSAVSVLHSLKSILNVFTSESLPSRDEYIANNYIASSAIISAAEVLPQIEYDTRKDAVQAAEDFQDIYDEYVEYTEIIEEPFNETLEDYIYSSVDINKAVQETVGAVIDKADNLKVEQHIVLSEPSNLISLACKYYRDEFKDDPEAAVDYLIKTNNFKEDDFLYLDRGREILIYV